jgi:hypothetical protein
MKEQYFINLEAELGVVVLKTLHTEPVIFITPVHSIIPVPVLLTNSILSLWFSFLLRWWKLTYKTSFW